MRLKQKWPGVDVVRMYVCMFAYIAVLFSVSRCQLEKQLPSGGRTVVPGMFGSKIVLQVNTCYCELPPLLSPAIKA